MNAHYWMAIVSFIVPLVAGASIAPTRHRQASPCVMQSTSFGGTLLEMLLEAWRWACGCFIVTIVCVTCLGNYGCSVQHKSASTIAVAWLRHGRRRAAERAHAFACETADLKSILDALAEDASGQANDCRELKARVTILVRRQGKGDSSDVTSHLDDDMPYDMEHSSA